MNLFIFTNSTGCMCYEGGKFIPNASYVDGLQEYRPEGMWINGVTVLHVSKSLPSILKGADRIAILHFGACEAFSHPPLNFLSLGCAHLLQQVIDPFLFQAYIAPKMFRATEVLFHNTEEFFRLLEPSEFESVLDRVLLMLQGTRVLMIGMSSPNDIDHPHWTHQALEYNEIMERACEERNVRFINIWDLLKDYVQDSTHLNVEGHKQLLGIVKTFIGENND